MSLTELYAYEMLSVDAIESVTDVDSSYISGWLAGIRSYVLGYETAGNADNNDMAAVADNDYNSLDESDYSDEEYDDSDYGYDENNNNDDYREREAVSSVYRKTGKRLKENAVTLFIKRLFPALTLPARMMVSWIAGGVIVIILIIILVVSVKAGKSNKKSASYEYQNMQYTTEQAATKNNKKNEAATASTEAGTEEQTTQKQAQTEAVIEAAQVTAASSAGSEMGKAVIDYATQFVGNPYVYGGTSLTNGTDCSGFVMSVYANFGVGLPHSSSALRSKGYDVGGLANAQPGDIVCYSGHVALYIGNGQIVHASTSKTGIIISNANYRSILAVRRIF